MAVQKASISIAAVEIVGFILDKARDCASKKLRDGDLTNEELHQILVRNLKEINTKLDSLSLKDLDASRSFLKEGISIFIIALDKQREDQETRGDPNEAITISTDGASGSLNAVLTLPQAKQQLSISPEKRLKEAKKCYQKARERATDAFNNNSLSIKDRIMACKIRVAARIFESGLEDPEVAVSACVIALEELLSLAAVRDMFEVLILGGGIRSWGSKAGRLENIMSVLLINHALFDFAVECSRMYPNVFTWSRIELADCTFHPILHAYHIVEKTSSPKEFAQQLNRMVVGRRIPSNANAGQFAVNSRGEIILLDDDKITVFYSSSESKDVMFSDESESNVVGRRGKAVAVDSDDNVYVLRYLKTRDKNGIKGSFVLCVLDENYNFKNDWIPLEFLNTGEDEDVRIAVDKNKNIVFVKYSDNQVFVCPSTGEFKFKFERDGYDLTNISITNKNEIILRSDDESAVHVYTTEGNLKSIIQVPEDHYVQQAAFHHGICKIVVLTDDMKNLCWSLLCYSETGELEHSVQYIRQWSWIASHPSGRFAVWQDENITFI